MKLPSKAFLDNKLKVSEIFYSIQGEGVRIGEPAVFVRLAGCNQRCSFCDSAYAFSTKDGLGSVSPQEVADIVRAYFVGSEGKRLVVITGGEPLLQQSQIVALIEELGSIEYQFEIETNGTVGISREELFTSIDDWVVSPKLNNSGIDPKDRRIKLYDLQSKGVSVSYKFVAESIDDLSEIDNFLNTYKMQDETIIIMPEGIDQDVIQKRMLELVPGVMKRGWRITPRLQISLWGNERGV